MNDESLDELLRKSAPEITVPLGLSEHRMRILDEVRSRRKRRKIRLWTVGVVGVLTLSGGTAAVAGNDLVTPWGWTADNAVSRNTSDGANCYMGFIIKAHGVSENSEVVRDAKKILAGIDIEHLDTAEAEKTLAVENSRATDANAEPSPIVLTPDELKRAALHEAVSDIVFTRLDQKGYDSDPSPISVQSQESACGR